MWLANIDGWAYFLPLSVTPGMIRSAVSTLLDEKVDADATRAALYQLWLSTKHEKMDPSDREAMFRLYVGNLSTYPPEAVSLVLSELSETAKFWPAWSEISSRLDQIFGKRAGLLNALRRAALKAKE